MTGELRTVWTYSLPVTSTSEVAERVAADLEIDITRLSYADEYTIGRRIVETSSNGEISMLLMTRDLYETHHYGIEYVTNSDELIIGLEFLDMARRATSRAVRADDDGTIRSTGRVASEYELTGWWVRWRDSLDPRARERLIVHYSPLVKFVAGRVGAGLPSSVDPGDLVSAGVFGLIDAVERFDSERGVKFETFAVPRIRGAIFDGLRSLDWVPRSVRSRAREMETAFHELEARLGRSPADDELSAHLGITSIEFQRWLAQIAFTTVGPLDRALVAGAEARRLNEIIEIQPGTYDEFEIRASIRAETRRLPDREKLVLSLFYDEGLTLSEIGSVLGVEEARVSQIHTQAVLHLRSRMSAGGMI